jgi:hypothetical protein
MDPSSFSFLKYDQEKFERVTVSESVNPEARTNKVPRLQFVLRFHSPPISFFRLLRALSTCSCHVSYVRYALQGTGP